MDTKPCTSQSLSPVNDTMSSLHDDSNDETYKHETKPPASTPTFDDVFTCACCAFNTVSLVDYDQHVLKCHSDREGSQLSQPTAIPSTSFNCVYKCLSCNFTTVNYTSFVSHGREAHRSQNVLPVKLPKPQKKAEVSSKPQLPTFNLMWKCLKCAFITEEYSNVVCHNDVTHLDNVDVSLDVKPSITTVEAIKIENDHEESDVNQAMRHRSAISDVAQSCVSTITLSKAQDALLGEIAYQCSQCSFWAPSSTRVDKHFTTRHSMNIPVVGETSEIYRTHSANGKKKRLLSDVLLTCKTPNCMYTTKNLSAFTRHSRNHLSTAAVESDEDDTYPFRCKEPNCTYAARIVGQLTRHMRTHTDIRRFRCDYPDCTYSAKMIRSLDRHKMRHLNVKPYICDVIECTFSTSTPSQLNNHKASAHSESRPYSCNAVGCTYSAKLWIHLSQHKHRMHPKVRPYICKETDCTFSTGTSMQLNDHKEMKHSNGPNYFCNECSYSTKTSCNLRHHKKAMHQRHKCTLPGCEHIARNIKQLGLHVKTMHAFRCVECPFTARYRIYLKKHIDEEHPEMGQRPFPSDYKCNTCTYYTSDEEEFEIHEREHVEEGDNEMGNIIIVCEDC